MSLKGLKKHIASHQQQLALFALPPNVDETEAEEREDEERSPIIAEDDEDSLDVAEDDADSLGSVEDSDGYQAVAWSTDDDDASESNQAPTQTSLHETQEDLNEQLSSRLNMYTQSPDSPDGSLQADFDVAFEHGPILSQYMDDVTTEMESQASNGQRHDSSIRETSDRPRMQEELERNKQTRTSRTEHRNDLDEEETAAVHFPLENDKTIDGQQQFQLPSETLPSANQPTYAKIHQQHLEIDTLHYYDIPYEFDSDPDYLIVLRELDQRETDVLFEHSRRLRSVRGDGKDEKPYSFVRKPSGSMNVSDKERSERRKVTLGDMISERESYWF
jgi:hypothetical protein